MDEKNRQNQSIHSAFVAAMKLHVPGYEKVVLVEHLASIVTKLDGEEFLQQHGWGLPGGMQNIIEPPEPPIVTAEREFNEEVRIQINPSDPVFVERPCDGYSVHTFFYNARNLRLNKLKPEDHLILRKEWFLLKDLPMKGRDAAGGRKPVLYKSAFSRIIAILLMIGQNDLALEILGGVFPSYSRHTKTFEMFKILGRADLAERFKPLERVVRINRAELEAVIDVPDPGADPVIYEEGRRAIQDMINELFADK